MDDGNTARTSPRKRGQGSHHRREGIKDESDGEPTTEEGKTGVGRLVDAEPVYLRWREARDRRGRREVRDFVGWTVVGRSRESTSTSSSPSTGAGTVCLLLEMPVVRSGAAAKVTDRQRSADGPPHPSGMGIGRNTFTYSDQSAGDSSRVRLTHRVGGAVGVSTRRKYPGDDLSAHEGETAGTDFAFEWAPAIDPDGDAIADYQFELSDQADMKWPLSMSFAKLISWHGGRRPGPLHPGRPWPASIPTVVICGGWRRQDNKGVWGAWSDTWTFVPARAAPPLDVTLSNSIPPEHVASCTGHPTPKVASPFPTEFMPATKRDSRSAIGPTRSRWGSRDGACRVTRQTSSSKPLPLNGRWWVLMLELAGANKAFYRVVAVDAAGKRSGPSDLAGPRSGPSFSASP